MVSASQTAVQDSTSDAPPATEARPTAHLNARISAYLVDSVILVAFILVFFVLAGAQLLVANSRSDGDPPDAAYYAFVAIFLGGVLLAWTLFNLALVRWRAQTAGMYVIGIRIVPNEGERLTAGQNFVRWFGLNPLLFHPFLLPLWSMLSLLLVSLIVSQLVLVVTVALVLLCIVSPLANLALMIIDAEGRALHDRLAGTTVVHLEAP
jgi:uncharacterized RDD family membrane protein YckC